jgi:hypothetical protein
LDRNFKAQEYLGLKEFVNVEKWLRSVLSRPPVEKAYNSLGVYFKPEEFGSPLGGQ